MRREALVRRCSNRSQHADGCDGSIVKEARKNNGTKFWPASFNTQMLWQTDFCACSNGRRLGLRCCRDSDALL